MTGRRPWWWGRERGCPPRPASPTPGSGLSATSGIFRRNTASRICIPGVSSPLTAWRSTGPGGAATSGTIGMWTRPSRCTGTCWTWWGRGTTSCSPPTWTTSSSGRALTRAASSTPRGTTACGSAPSPATPRPTTTRRRCAGCWRSRGTCGCPPGWCPTAPSAAGP